MEYPRGEDRYGENNGGNVSSGTDDADRKHCPRAREVGDLDHAVPGHAVHDDSCGDGRDKPGNGRQGEQEPDERRSFQGVDGEECRAGEEDAGAGVGERGRAP